MTDSEAAVGSPRCGAAVCLASSLGVLIFKGLFDHLAGNLNPDLGPAWLVLVAAPFALLVFCLRTARNELQPMDRVVATIAAWVCILSAQLPIEANSLGHLAFPFLTFGFFVLATSAAAVCFRQWLFVAGWAAYVVWYTMPFFRSPGAPFPRAAKDDAITIRILGVHSSVHGPGVELVFRIEGLEEDELRLLGPRTMHIRPELGPRFLIAHGRFVSVGEARQPGTNKIDKTFAGEISIQPWMRTFDLSIEFPTWGGGMGRSHRVVRERVFQFVRLQVRPTV